MSRKTPIKHSVKSHMRNGHRVSSYTRGKGKASPTGQRRRVITPGTKFDKPKSFTVNFGYDLNNPKDGETVIVIAKSYEQALDEAFEEKKDKRMPESVSVIDPDFGAIFSAIGHGLKRVGHLGGQYLIRGAKASGRLAKQGAKAGGQYAKQGIKYGGKKAGEAIAESYHSQQAKRLVDKAYSENRSIRIVARAQLKQQFPEVYEICSFSRER